jgi:ribosomal protein L27
MRKLSIFIIVLFLLSFLPCTQAVSAQEQETAHVVSSTLPVAPELRAAVDAWLAASPPSFAIYYGITYAHPHGVDQHYVCLVGLNIPSPDAPWSFTGDKDGNSQVVWMGTVIVYNDGSVHLVTQDPVARYDGGLKVLAIPSFAPSYGAGGGPYVRFPWQPSKAVRLGVLGLHNTGYGQNSEANWRAIDLVSGSNMGTGAANDSVYTSVSGTVDYVCKDSASVAVIMNLRPVA